MKIDFANLQLQYRKYKDDIDANIQAVLNKSNFIMGEEVYELEHALEEFTGVKYAITCSSGTDALLLAMMALDIKPGDEIITTPFTFVATIETIARLYAKPGIDDIESELENRLTILKGMNKNIEAIPFTQRQLRVGEMIKQSLGQIFLRDEAKVPTIETKNITVTEVRMSPDLKNARAYVIPLGGKDAEKTVTILTEFSSRIRKALSKKVEMKFLPKVSFVSDKSFDYAEKIEKLIKENK